MSAHLVALLAVQAIEVRGRLLRERDPRVIDCLERSIEVLEITGTLAHEAALASERLAAAERRSAAQAGRLVEIEAALSKILKPRPWWRIW